MTKRRTRADKVRAQKRQLNLPRQDEATPLADPQKNYIIKDLRKTLLITFLLLGILVVFAQLGSGGKLDFWR